MSHQLTSKYPLRWGFLSTARINHVLVPVLRASKRNQLIAISSRSLDTAQAYAKEWKIPRSYGSYTEMLADPEVDVVYNSLPNSLHAEWTIKAAQVGKHVLCEKPLAISVNEVDAITAAARKGGVVIAEGFMYRHHPQTLKVKELIDDGVIGDVSLVRGSFSFNLSRMGDVRLDPDLGGGSIWDVGCYPISFARYIIGCEPLEVFGWKTDTSSGVDQTFVGQLRFPGGGFAQFDCSFRSPFRAGIEIVGTRGTISVSNPYKPGKKGQVHISRDGEVETLKISGQELYLGEVEDMADAILDGKQQRISLEDSRGNIATIAALLHSARQGSPVPLAARALQATQNAPGAVPGGESIA